MCYGLNLPPLSWEHPIRLSSSPLLKKNNKKKSFPSYLCCCTSSSSFHSAIQFFVLQSFCHGEGLPLSTAMLRSRLGLRKVTFAPPASWGKVNHIPPVFMFGVSGVTCWSLPIVWGFLGAGPASFCIVLCGIHCLDHAGCQGCCCDTNDIWGTSVPVPYFESLGH